MHIDENSLIHWIDNFYGYGSWNARTWFVANEEGGGETPEEVAEKFNYLVKEYPPVTNGILCDIREVYKRVSMRPNDPNAAVFSNRYEYRFASNAKQNGLWKNLISFIHGYNNEPLPDLLTYQKKSFASPAAQHEALMALYPLPGPHSHAWYYSWLNLPLTFLKSRALYEEHVYDTRVQRILSNISTYKPAVVLMYGMHNINKLKNSVQDKFHNAKFSMIKATKQQIPQHHRADINGTTLLITTQIPALRHNRIETGFDWQKFGHNVKSGHATSFESLPARD